MYEKCVKGFDKGFKYNINALVKDFGYIYLLLFKKGLDEMYFAIICYYLLCPLLC